MVALEMADHILLVTQLDLPCLRNVVRLMTSFGEMKGMADKVKIVVNRVGLDSGQISLKKAQETIGREIFWQLPNDYRTMVEVRNNGVPLIEQAPRAAITHSIAHWPTPSPATTVGDPDVDGPNPIAALPGCSICGRRPAATGEVASPTVRTECGQFAPLPGVMSGCRAILQAAYSARPSSPNRHVP